MSNNSCSIRKLFYVLLSCYLHVLLNLYSNFLFWVTIAQLCHCVNPLPKKRCCFLFLLPYLVYSVVALFTYCQ